MGGSPSPGVRYTPSPSPRAIGDGPMAVDPVFRAVAHTGNARDSSLAKWPRHIHDVFGRGVHALVKRRVWHLKIA